MRTPGIRAAQREGCLIIGPRPPAVGGIASIVGVLEHAFAGDHRYEFLDTSKPVGRVRRALRPVTTLARVGGALARRRFNRVLIFSSTGASFWEKCMWIATARTFTVRPFVMMVDGNAVWYFDSLSNWRMRLARNALRRAVIIAQSASWRAFYEARFPEATIAIVSPGVDTDFFTPRPWHREGRPPVLLYVGWMIAAKGIEDLFAACARLSRDGYEFRLRCVGPTFGTNRIIAARLKKYGLEDRVETAGALERTHVRREYLAADVFVFPSHYEGLPVAVLEAMASGLPCIATSVGAVPDVLDHGRVGLLVPPRDPLGLANAIARLLDDAGERQRLGAAAAARVSACYSLARSAESFDRVLSQR